MSNSIGPWANQFPTYMPWIGPQSCTNIYKNLPAPKLAAAVQEAHENLGVSPGLVMFSALAAMSLSIQGLADVQIPGGQTSRLALYLLSIAGSGQGKTRAQNMMLSSLFKLQSEYLNRYASEIKCWERENLVWEERLCGLQQALRKKHRKGELATDEEAAVHEHLVRKPVSPRKGQFLFEDATMAALLYALYQNGVSAGLISSEGGSILYGEALKEPQKLNALFSGESLIVDRKSAPSFVLEDIGFTMGIMCQPDVLADYMGNKRGEKAKATGLNARWMVCNAQPYEPQQPDPRVTLSWTHCEAFNQRTAELMQRTLMSTHVDGVAREVLRFTPEAAMRFGEVRGKIRQDMLGNGLYARAQDHAARLPEILARLAALIHKFEGFPGDIGLPALEAAITICQQASYDYLTVFVPPPKEVLDAEAVYQWIYREMVTRNIQGVDRSYLLNLGPVRKARALDTALAVLGSLNRAVFSRHGRTTYVAVVAPRSF